MLKVFKKGSVIVTLEGDAPELERALVKQGYMLQEPKAPAAEAAPAAEEKAPAPKKAAKPKAKAKK